MELELHISIFWNISIVPRGAQIQRRSHFFAAAIPTGRTRLVASSNGAKGHLRWVRWVHWVMGCCLMLFIPSCD
jgi:hypothetical protein